MRTRLLLLLLALTAYTPACSILAPKFERPDISVASIEWLTGNLVQQNFRVKFNIENPNNRDLPVTSLHAELDVAGGRLASGVSNSAFVVPAHGSSQFDMTITANMAAVLLQLGQHKNGHSNSIDYDMTGGASIDLPFLRDLPFHQHGSLPLNLR